MQSFKEYLEEIRRTSTMNSVPQWKETTKREILRDLFRKIGNIKQAFHPKMGTIKHKNGRDLVDDDEIKKRWEEYREELY